MILTSFQMSAQSEMIANGKMANINVLKEANSFFIKAITSIKNISKCQIHFVIKSMLNTTSATKRITIAYSDMVIFLLHVLLGYKFFKTLDIFLSRKKMINGSAIQILFRFFIK